MAETSSLTAWTRSPRSALAALLLLAAAGGGGAGIRGLFVDEDVERAVKVLQDVQAQHAQELALHAVQLNSVGGSLRGLRADVRGIQDNQLLSCELLARVAKVQNPCVRPRYEPDP